MDSDVFVLNFPYYHKKLEMADLLCVAVDGLAGPVRQRFARVVFVAEFVAHSLLRRRLDTDGRTCFHA
jgi:hypothetical protein